MSLQEKSELVNTDGTLDPITFLLREYEALREEILKRMEIENQLTGLAMIALGTLATFAVQYQNPLLLLSYPTLAMFLSFGWSHSDNEDRNLYQRAHRSKTWVRLFRLGTFLRCNSQGASVAISLTLTLSFIQQRNFYRDGDICTHTRSIYSASHE